MLVGGGKRGIRIGLSWKSDTRRGLYCERWHEDSFFYGKSALGEVSGGKSDTRRGLYCKRWH